MVKVTMSRDQAEALIDVAISDLLIPPQEPHLLDALKTLVLACGMVKDESKLDDWLERQGVL